MATILAGTGYNQVIEFYSNDKQKNKLIFGQMARSPVKYLTKDYTTNALYYSTAKNIYFSNNNENSEEIVSIQGQQNIVSLFVEPTKTLTYLMSNGSAFLKRLGLTQEGSLIQAQEPFQQIIIAQKHNKFTKGLCNSEDDRYLFIGAGVVPIITNIITGVQDWYGKNVKNDFLDLEVPMRDIDASFIKDNKWISVLTADRKIRLYDTRGTNRRPAKDITLPVTEKCLMTKMLVSPCENYYYVSNDIGEIFKCDSRADWKHVCKYKGITTSITDISASRKTLIASSLDSYIYLFNEEEGKISKKFYMNKPVHSLFAVYDDEKQLGEFEEEQVDLDEEEQVAAKNIEKLKQIRKRNKVGLKYLEPREFDQPQLKQQEQLHKKEWYEDLNPIDRNDFM